MGICEMGCEAEFTVACIHGVWCAEHAVRHAHDWPACRDRVVAVAKATVEAVLAGYNDEEAQLVGVFDVPGWGVGE